MTKRLTLSVTDEPESEARLRDALDLVAADVWNVPIGESSKEQGSKYILLLSAGCVVTKRLTLSVTTVYFAAVDGMY